MKNKKNYFPNLTQSAILCFLLLSLSILISLLLPFVYLVNDSSILMIWMNLPIFSFVFLVGILWSGKRVNAFLKNKKIEFKFFVPLFIITIGFIIIIGEITNVLFYFYPIPNYILDEFDHLLSNKWGVVATIVIAAITEECFFRGMILSGLNKNHGFWMSIVLSSSMFAFVHIIPWQIIPAFIAGIFLGWIYLKFKSIILCIIIHAFNNALAAIPEYYNIEIKGIVYNIKEGVQFQPIWLDLLGLLMFFYGMFIINKNFKYD